MRFGEKELAVVRAEIRAMEKHIEVLEMVKRVLKDFDGKLISQDIKDALQKSVTESGTGGVLELVSMLAYGTLQLRYTPDIQEAYNDKDAWQSAVPEEHKSGYALFETDMLPAIAFGYASPLALNYGKVSGAIEEAVERYSHALDQYRTAMARLDEIEEEYQELSDRVAQFEKPLPPIFKKHYGIRYR